MSLIFHLIIFVHFNMYCEMYAWNWACLDRQLFIYRCFYLTRKWNLSEMLKFLEPIGSRRIDISNNWFFRINQNNNTNDLMNQWHFLRVYALCTRLSKFLIKQWRIGTWVHSFNGCTRPAERANMATISFDELLKCWIVLETFHHTLLL